MTPEERFWNRRRLAQTLTAIAALWAVAALMTLVGGWQSSAAARAATGWTAVEGTVTAAEVVAVAQRGRVPFTVPGVRVAYAYTYRGREYRGDRLRADGDPVGPQSAAGRAWLALAPGASVTVYVNPADPTQAALERGTTGRWLPNALLLLVLAGGAEGLGWALGRRSRNR
ncbi:MAG: DUF3592 domain-containing protein [Candidatus Promineofilum sp.]|nr:DUF3592 domain-containing protein [Promineifilum sp.]